MNTKSVDVLNLEWTSTPSRDREVVALVANYLRLQGYEVFEGAIFEGYTLIDKLQPSVLYITNSVGAKFNIDIIKYAKSKGIKCITGMAEGNFNEAGIKQFFWGVNEGQVLHEDYTLLWNKYCLNLIKEYYPHLVNRVGVSGAIGFDRYRVVGKDQTTQIPIDHNKYRFVVGVGCWNFDFTINDSYCFRMFNGHEISIDELERFRTDRNLFNNEILKLIQDNPQTLFLLKLHPGCQGGDFSSAIAGCRNFSNILIIKNEYSVYDCILRSDIWLTYESTTAVEAWLLDIPTALLNPTGTDFPFREGFHEAQPNYETAEKWSNLIDLLVRGFEFEEFLKLKNYRDRIIKEMIQWNDGLNHVRMGNEIVKLIISKAVLEKDIKLTTYDKFKRYKRQFIWMSRNFLKVFPKSLRSRYNNYINWDYKKVKELSKIRMLQQKKFYHINSLDLIDLSKITAYFDSPNKHNDSLPF